MRDIIFKNQNDTNIMNIFECTDIKSIESTYGVTRQLYDIDIETYLSHIEEMRSSDYSLFSMVNDEGKCIAVVGYRIGRRLYCGKYLHIDNLIVSEDCRSKGIAKKLVDFCKNSAKENNCDVILADSYVENRVAHRLFLQEKFHIRGFHFKFDL